MKIQNVGWQEITNRVIIKIINEKSIVFRIYIEVWRGTPVRTSWKKHEIIGQRDAELGKLMKYHALYEGKLKVFTVSLHA